jgi:hypothetical protein
MSAPQLTEFTDSMTNVNDDITLNYGRHLLTVLTAFHWRLLLTKRFSAVTGD